MLKIFIYFHIKQEKTVLDLANFPFILSFVKSFDDLENLYFLTEVIKGMELFDVIREIGLLGTFDSQFYVASLILSLEYLHQLKVIYRDLKPENIMINEQVSQPFLICILIEFKLK